MSHLPLRETFETMKKSDTVVFFDRKPDSALDLLTAFVLRRFAVSSAKTHVHFLCFERKPSFWKRRLDKHLDGRVTYYDFWYNSFGWNDASRLIDATDVVSRLCQSVKDPNISLCDHHIVVMDSTALLLLTVPANHLCLLLVDLPQQIIQGVGRSLLTSMVVLHHTDLYDTYSELALRAISTASFNVVSASHNRSREREFVCATSMPRREAPIVLLQKVIIDPGWKIRYEMVDSQKQAVGPMTTSNQVDFVSDLSFNLKLTDDERQAKNQVPLPHSRGAGVIYYEPDEADDIDYDEPDE